jgi:excisionase family DNA binding protein
MNTTAKEYLNTRELAELLGVSVRTVATLRQRRAIPYVKLGRVVRFKRDAVEAALKSFTVEGITSALRKYR